MASKVRSSEISLEEASESSKPSQLMWPKSTNYNWKWRYVWMWIYIVVITKCPSISTSYTKSSYISKPTVQPVTDRYVIQSISNDATRFFASSAENSILRSTNGASNHSSVERLFDEDQDELDCDPLNKLSQSECLRFNCKWNAHQADKSRSHEMF